MKVSCLAIEVLKSWPNIHVFENLPSRKMMLHCAQPMQKLASIWNMFGSLITL